MQQSGVALHAEAMKILKWHALHFIPLKCFYICSVVRYERVKSTLILKKIANL